MSSTVNPWCLHSSHEFNMHSLDSGWQEYFLKILWGWKGHLSICMHYSTLRRTMKCFRRSHASMCFEVSCYYKCTVYELWWSCIKDWRLTAYLIRKERFLHRYHCLSHSTFPIHLAEDQKNTAFVHVFSLLGSLLWVVIFLRVGVRDIWSIQHILL